MALTRWLSLPLAGLLWLVLSLAGLQPRVERALGDLLLRATAPPPAADAPLRLDIDDLSLRQLRPALGEWPYSREVYALMLDYLREAGVRLVVMDIVFAGPREGDERFAEALRRGPPAVLGAAGLATRPGLIETAPLQGTEAQALQRLGQPAEGLAGTAWSSLTLPADGLLAALEQPGSLGLVSTPLDEDGVLRRVPLLHAVDGRLLPSLGLAAWLRSQQAGSWRQGPAGLEVGGASRATDAQARVLLRLPRPESLPAALPWGRLMGAALGQAEDASLRRELAGRTVFVGSSAFFADEVMTPLGRFSGAAFNAAVYQALGEGQVLRESGAGYWAAHTALLLLAALPALLLGRGRPQLGCQGLAVALVLLAGGALALGLVGRAGLLLVPTLALYTVAIGLVLGVVARFRWDTAREHELERERELAEAGSQAKTEMLAQVSHEMRTPLNAVLGFADILARAPLPSREAHYVELIGHAGRQVFALINDLLDNARLQGGKLTLAPHEFDLVELVEMQLELLRVRAIEKRLQLRLFAPLELHGLVRGDSRRVAQIVANLVGNAIKFTAEGSVTVRLEREAEGLVLLSVQDSGIGIAAEEVERIFTPYAQAHAGIAGEFGGTGLGLSITRSLARLMGGEVRVQSLPGKGSRFEVRMDLPPVDPAVARPAADEPRGAAPTGPLELLLAEDNEVNALVVEAMLQPLGHAVVRARDGDEALQRLRERAFDLVLMDMEMPHRDGLDATRVWRSEERASGRPPLPIVALTANAFDADVQACLAAGCDAHLAKPISQAALLQMLARYARG